MPNKVLTISIASYNTEKYIEETVKSLIIEKDYLEKLEIIIVNDGSKDNTSIIAHKLMEEHPESIRVIDKQNGGYGSTINESLAVAEGKYYKLLDGDDWYKTENLKSFIDYLEQEDADLVITPYYEVRHNDLLIDTHTGISSQKVNIDEIEWNNQPLLMHEIAVKTEVLKRANKKIAEKCFYTDSEYVFYCICHSKTVSRYEKPIYRYRLGIEGQSVSLEGIRKHQRDLPIVAERIMLCYEKECSQIGGKLRGIVDLCVENITYHTYRSFFLLINPEKSKSELQQLDARIKEKYPLSYQAGNRSKLVRLVRTIRFHLYKLICILAQEKFRKENNS